MPGTEQTQRTMPLIIPQGQMWYAAVDYIRCTYRSKGDERLEHDIVSAIQRITSDNILGLCREERWKWMGFNGWRLGTCAYGHNGADRYIYQGSGVSAQPLFDARLPFDHMSRLDIQVTIWYEPERPDLIKAVAAASNAARNGRRGRPWKVRYIDGMGEGDTTYIGKRGKKSKFLRAYDKARETSGVDAWRGALRFECELTDVYAVQAARRLVELPPGANSVARVVAGFWAERGIELPESYGGLPLEPDKLPKDEGSVARRLRWLETQVNPAIDKLIADGVSLSVIGEALGLTVVAA